MGAAAVVPWVQGMGGLCMGLTGSEGVEGTAVTMMVVQAYNCCIGTKAESPKQGMHRIATGSRKQPRCDPHTGSQWQSLILLVRHIVARNCPLTQKG